MKARVQARLDEESRKTLIALSRALGWTPSRVVREGLRVLEASYLRRRIRGVIDLQVHHVANTAAKRIQDPGTR